MIALSVILFSIVFGLSSQAEWSYNDEVTWPGYCSTGLKQSPINIVTSQAIIDRSEAHLVGALDFRGYKSVQMTSHNNGHTLTWDAVGGTPPTLSGGPLRGNYTFAQFHLHWLSEHAIDGIKYPLEIHMVHVKTGLEFNEAVLVPDGLAVIGFMAEVHSGADADFALEEIAASFPLLNEQHSKDEEIRNIDLTRMFSPDPQSYFTYAGSLTTPNCYEAVTWIVMEKPFVVSDTHHKMITKVDIGGVQNYRDIQPVHYRTVYRSSASCLSLSVPTLLVLLAHVASCISSSASNTMKKAICTLINVKRKLLGQSVKDCARYVQ